VLPEPGPEAIQVDLIRQLPALMPEPGWPELAKAGLTSSAQLPGTELMPRLNEGPGRLPDARKLLGHSNLIDSAESATVFRKEIKCCQLVRFNLNSTEAGFFHFQAPREMWRTTQAAPTPPRKATW
jgi:hypothetical protein